MTNEQMRLRGRRVAALVTDGFEQSELSEPVAALREQGAEVDIITPGGKEARGWSHTDWGESVAADGALGDADPARYDGLLLPGGVISPDKLRIDEQAIAFVRAFADGGKPIAAICHGPWTLINAGAVAGREMTSYPSLRADLENAGAYWVDREVVVDGKLVTSRKPDDLPAFNRAMVDVFSWKAGGDGGQVSSAPNASFAEGAGRDSIGQDADALAGNTLGNTSYPSGNAYPQPDKGPRRDED